MAAVVRVATMPLPSALKATREMLWARGGAMRESKPTWIPSDDRLPNPQSAYVAMSLSPQQLVPNQRARLRGVEGRA